MYTAKVVPAEHKDLIHDVSFDFYGKRMATCSSDQSVKVWDQDDKGEWTCTAEWRTHSGSVWRVTWASPEFGQVIATCSFDRTAAVWEEQVSEVNQSHHGGRSVHWVQRASLVDSRTSVTDIEFAPKHLGLQLATCSKDGIVRIYEAPDVMNLSHWSLQHEINTKLSCSCLSWNPSRMRSAMLAVGSDDQASTVEGKVQVYEYNDATRKWHRILSASTITDPVNDVAFAPNFGRSHSLLAVASKDVHLISVKSQGKEVQQSGGTSNRSDTLYTPVVFRDHDSQVWRVEWNITGTILASSGDDGCVRLWKANYLDNWKCVAELKGDGVPIPGAQTSKPLSSSIRDPGPFNASNPSSIRSHPMY